MKWSSSEDVKAYQKKYREKNKGKKKTRFNKFVKANYINADDMYYGVKIKKEKLKIKIEGNDRENETTGEV
jgi:hypothetical protein